MQQCCVCMDYKKILENKGLSVTNARLMVLEYFDISGKAQSMSSLLKAIKGSNRITLYRTLKQFVDKQILMSFSGDNNLPVYCISQAIHIKESSTSQAIFICNKCKTVITRQIHTSIIDTVFSEFIIKNEKILIKGYCPNCSKNIKL